MNTFTEKMMIIAVAFAGGLLGLGCASFHPTKACFDKPIPARVKFMQLNPMETMEYVDEEGKHQTMMILAVEPSSALKFFEYVEELEDLAKHAATCRR